MKQTIRQYGLVVALLACLLAVAVLVTTLAGNGPAPAEDAPRRYTAVLATTYPIYVAAEEILGTDAPDLLSRLEGAASGCLHDYQMSPIDRRAVEEARLVLLNGAGAESFLHGIVDENKCVDTSAGLDLLLLDGDHHHDHADGEHPHEEMNEHLWLSPALYAKQVLAVLDALIAHDDEYAAVYRSNAENYLRHIDFIRDEITALKSSLEGTPCVLFHDSMAYLAADLGLDVKLTLSVEGESGLSAADLKKVEALAKEYPDLLLFYDTQYALRYEGVGGTAVSIHTAVQEKWVDAMNENVKALQAVAEGR